MFSVLIQVTNVAVANFVEDDGQAGKNKHPVYFIKSWIERAVGHEALIIREIMLANIEILIYSYAVNEVKSVRIIAKVPCLQLIFNHKIYANFIMVLRRVRDSPNSILRTVS